MAPEQADGSGRTGPASDVYALGGILYFVLTARAPFAGENVMEVLQKVMNRPPIPPRFLNPRVPEGLQAICLKCLEKDPQKRYASAAELAGALRPWTDPAAADRPVAVGRDRRRRVTAAVALALLVGAGLLAGAWWWGWRPGRRQPSGPPEEPAFVPEPVYHDFDLRVQLLDSKQDEGGIYRPRDGQKLVFRVTTEHDAYVGLWDVTPDGAITQIFPSKYERDNLVRAGAPRTIPGNDKYDMWAAEPGRVARIWVIASNQAWDPLAGQEEGPFVVFKTADERRAWQAQQKKLRQDRGERRKVVLKARPGGPEHPRPAAEAMELSEAVLTYNVVGRGSGR
jgi:hypothetical protein